MSVFTRLDYSHISLTPRTFDSVQSAQRAKASLNGADIYSGCCTLKIEYAKVRIVNIVIFSDGGCSQNHQVKQINTFIFLSSRHVLMYSRMTKTHGTTPIQT